MFTAVIETAQQDTASIAEERFAAFFRESGDMEADLSAAARIWTDMVLAPEVSGLRRVIIAEQWRHPEIAANGRARGRRSKTRSSPNWSRTSRRATSTSPTSTWPHTS
ncbi:hypothetical protein ACU686_08505 [Yinghuangia aomiensis]